MKMKAFWDIASRTLVEISRHFIALIMEVVRTSETSAYFNETARRYVPYSYLKEVSNHRSIPTIRLERLR
jgi:Arc/MetJ family transcription regulator